MTKFTVLGTLFALILFALHNTAQCTFPRKPYGTILRRVRRQRPSNHQTKSSRPDHFILNANLQKITSRVTSPLLDAAIGDGATGESCRVQGDCGEDRSCYRVTEEGYPVPCHGTIECYCYPDYASDETCSCENQDCLDGDICAIFDGDTTCNAAGGNPAPVRCDDSPPVPTPSSKEELRFTGESCTKTKDCAKSRSCYAFDGDDLAPCRGEEECYCFPNNGRDEECSCENTKCLDGDECVLAEGESFCQSTRMNLPPVFCDGPPPEPVSEGGDKITDELCTTDDDCLSRRSCYWITDEGGHVPCRGREDCFCYPDLFEDTDCSCEDPACLEGDVCIMTRKESFCVPSTMNSEPLNCDGPRPDPCARQQESPFPTTEDGNDQDALETSPQPSEEQESVCIDAEALSHLQAHELVYEEHVVSRVLCDNFGSCATPGHIVQYKGSAMMMKRYCGMVGCEERSMKVNSPKYRRGMRVKSRTDGLEFTVFAARYETRAEEFVMSSAVRAGL